MRSSKDIEKFVRDGKPNVKTSKQMDKLALDNSYKVMDAQIRSTGCKFCIFDLITRKSVTSVIAASMAIVLLVGLFIYKPEQDENTDISEVPGMTQTSTDVMSLLSVNLAYKRGGLDEVEKQYEKAITDIGPRPAQITIADLLAELNGT